MHSIHDSAKDQGLQPYLTLLKEAQFSRPALYKSKTSLPEYLSEHKMTSSALQLVDQIKAQTKVADSLGKQDTKDIFKTEPLLSNHLNHVLASLHQELSASNEKHKPVCRMSSQTLPQEAEDLGIECPAKFGPLDEDKCLKMILNPEFVEALQVLKQGSGSTIEASTQSETCFHEIRKFDIGKEVKDSANEEITPADCPMEPEMAGNDSLKEETKLQELGLQKSNLKTRK